MTNFEKYEDILKSGILGSIGVSITTGEPCACSDLDCYECRFSAHNSSSPTPGPCSGRVIQWLYEEYKECEIDWSKVPKFTRVIASDDEGRWYKGYFIKFRPTKEYPFTTTDASEWSYDECSNCDVWRYCKLADDVDPTPYLK